MTKFVQNGLGVIPFNFQQELLRTKTNEQLIQTDDILYLWVFKKKIKITCNYKHFFLCSAPVPVVLHDDNNSGQLAI